MGLWNRMCGGTDIVEFSNGQYGLLQGWGLNKHFVDSDGGTWLVTDRPHSWCMYSEYTYAVEVRNKHAAISYREVIG